MRQPIPEKNRRFVAQRANHRCEYCHVHQDDSFLGFEIDHIISLKHGGGNEIESIRFAYFKANFITIRSLSINYALLHNNTEGYLFSKKIIKFVEKKK